MSLISQKSNLLDVSKGTVRFSLLFISKAKALLPLNLPRVNKKYLFDLLDSHLIHYATPITLTYAWSFGSLAGVCLVIQMISGIFLAMHYTPHIDLAFSSVEYIMRDVNNGWLVRYIHANGASMFFIVVYAHIGRGLYYGSYMAPRQFLWCSGVIILLLMMGTAFTGALVGHVEGLIYTFTQSTLISIIFNLVLGSLLRGWVVTSRFLEIFFLNNQQCGLKGTIGGGVKGCVLAFKTSNNCLKAQICIVSRFNLAFLSC